MVATDTDNLNARLAAEERLDLLDKRTQQLPLTWVRVPG